MEFLLRPFKKADLNSLVLHANNWNIAKYLNDSFPHPYTKKAGREFLEMAMRNQPANFLAIVIDGAVVGGVGIHQQPGVLRKSAEIGYWLSESYWGKGIVSKALAQAIDYAFATYEVDRLFGRVFEGNAASIKVLEHNGFKLEAKFDKTIIKNDVYYDEYIYALRRK